MSKPTPPKLTKAQAEVLEKVTELAEEYVTTFQFRMDVALTGDDRGARKAIVDARAALAAYKERQETHAHP